MTLILIIFQLIDSFSSHRKNLFAARCEYLHLRAVGSKFMLGGGGEAEKGGAMGIRDRISGAVRKYALPEMFEI